MFEPAELGRTTSKEDYKKYEEAFRVGLLTVQYDLREAASFPVILVIGGADRFGCQEVLNLLHEWMERIGASNPGPREARYQNHAEESNFRG